MDLKKILYSALGIAATLFGILGVWLPGLPTTVFLLIALWAFSNSSPRLYRWLNKIPVLKIALSEAHRFQHEGTIDKRAKIVSQACAWLSFVAVTLVLHSLPISVIVGLLALSCSVFMYYVPTTERAVRSVK